MVRRPTITKNLYQQQQGVRRPTITKIFDQQQLGSGDPQQLIFDQQEHRIHYFTCKPLKAKKMSRSPSFFDHLFLSSNSLALTFNTLIIHQHFWCITG
jgi:hypothetical protein